MANFFRLGSSLPATFFCCVCGKNRIFPSDTSARDVEKNRDEKKGVCFYIVDHYKNLKNTHIIGGKKKRSWAIFKYIHMNKSLKRVSPFFLLSCCCFSTALLMRCARTKLRHAGWWWRAAVLTLFRIGWLIYFHPNNKKLEPSWVLLAIQLETCYISLYKSIATSDGTRTMHQLIGILYLSCCISLVRLY